MSIYAFIHLFKYLCLCIMFINSTIQDRIYWTDLEDEAIYSANRLTGHDVAKVAEHLNNPLDLVVFHEQRQPKGKTCRTSQQWNDTDFACAFDCWVIYCSNRAKMNWLDGEAQVKGLHCKSCMMGSCMVAPCTVPFWFNDLLMLKTVTKIKKTRCNILLPGNKALNYPCLDQWFHLLKLSQTINK